MRMTPPAAAQMGLEPYKLSWVRSCQGVPSADHHRIYDDPNERFQVMTKPVLEGELGVDALFVVWFLILQSGQQVVRHK